MDFTDIIRRVEDLSPIGGMLLKDAEFDLREDEGLLTVGLKRHGVFMLRTAKMDAAIENMARERLGKDLRLILKDPEGEAISYESRPPTPAPVYTPPLKNSSPKPKAKRGSNPKTQGSSFRKAASGVPSAKIQALNESLVEGDEIAVEGILLRIERTNTRTGRHMCVMDITDGIDSITIKAFLKSAAEFEENYAEFMVKGKALRAQGKVRYDDYAKELILMGTKFAPGELKLGGREDKAAEKRVELHMHTQMSQMDAIGSVSDCIKMAADFGMSAVAITDHGNVQAFPEAAALSKKHGIKVIYGMEAYLVDDMAAIVENPCGDIDGDFVVFDVETTGLEPDEDTIIEIGAVKIRGGEIIGQFSALIDPGFPLPGKIMKITGLKDHDLAGKPRIDRVLPEFLEFLGEGVLVAHNARFDNGFLRRAAGKIGRNLTNPILCTLELTRALFPQVRSHKLSAMAAHLEIELKNHHRALNDAMATAGIFIKCREILKTQGISLLKDVNGVGSGNIDVKKLPLHHAIILVKNQSGLRNLYELVSLSNLSYFYKRPRIPKSLLGKKREGLILGTACESGEFFKAVLRGESMERLGELAEFYDYIELQSHKNNMYMVREGIMPDEDALIGLNKRIVELGEHFGKPVAATCDVHFLNPEDSVYREIIMTGEGFKDASQQAPLYFRTTEEMLAEFSYLRPEKAYEVVITNTCAIADAVEEVHPLPKGMFPPRIEGSDEELMNLINLRVAEVYGPNPPEEVTARLERELGAVFQHGFSSMYNAAQIITRQSIENGYLVGSRGSIGASFAATMSGITEVNPLPAHYYCSTCFFTDFKAPEIVEMRRKLPGLSSCDLPDKTCPNCGLPLKKDGHEILFEIFLGFDCDKEPDIDLNFSGEYQARAHAHAEELFGEGHVFKAGTIGTLAEKTAFGFVNGYLEEKGLVKRSAERNRLVSGLVGIKRTTGQHPGGVIIVPKGHDIHEFCPVQRPADNQDSHITTTHFDYHSALEGRLMKLDILGHDAPTVIRLLHDFTGVDPLTVDIGNKEIMSIFTSSRALGIKDQAPGTLGIPEFGTAFVRQMLTDTKPDTFTGLVKISGLSHGTDVWIGNAADLVRNGVATLNEIVAARDDILIYLMGLGIDNKLAFNIMEKVRKGKGLNEAEAEAMAAAGAPQWYIDSCKLIKYLFPKAHAVAYVMMSVRIAFYKIYHPMAFYAASYSVKTEDVDYETMCKGPETAGRELNRINALGREATAKDKNAAVTIELVLEMYTRNITFLPINIYESHQYRFIPTLQGILPPLMTLAGLGGNAAQAIVDAREKGEFISRQDFKERAKISKTVMELFVRNGFLNDLQETNQLTLFGMMEQQE